MKFDVFIAMDIGPRDRQEDALLLDGRIYREERLDLHETVASDGLLAAVCDGMGGHADGDQAGPYVLERLRDAVDPVAATADELRRIVSAIQEKALTGMPPESGTTLAGLILNPRGAVVFNAGDSRVYRLAANRLECVSHDHSLVQSLVDKGHIAPEHAFDHPQKNIVNLGLGPVFRENWKVRTLHTQEIPETGGRYLICSDGVNDVLRDSEIADLLKGNIASAAAALLAALKDRGPKDNTGFILVEAADG